MENKEANPGEFTLVYNSIEGGYCAVLSTEQHELLQQLLPALGTIQVVKNMKVRYEML